MNSTVNQIVAVNGFDYSALSGNQLENIRQFETEIEDILMASSYRIGKVLLSAKESLEHGCFSDWLKQRWGWSERSARNMMNISKNFKSAQCADLFPKAAQNKLAAPSVSEGVRQQAINLANSGANVDHKMVDELKMADKKIAALEKLITPDHNNLIPDLKRLINSYDGISEKQADTYSILSKDAQQNILGGIQSRQSLLRTIDNLNAEKATLAQSATKAHEKADAMQSQFDDAVDKGSQSLLAEKDKEIRLKEIELTNVKIEIRKKAEKEASELHARLNKETIETANKGKETAEKAKRQAQEKASGAYEENIKLESKIKRLEEQLEVNSPTNVDLAMEKQIRSLTDGVQFAIRGLQKDMLEMGGGSMERSIIALEDLNKGITLSVAALKGDSKQMIKTTGV